MIKFKNYFKKNVEKSLRGPKKQDGIASVLLFYCGKSPRRYSLL